MALQQSPYKRPRPESAELIRKSLQCYRNFIDANPDSDHDLPILGEYIEDQDNGAYDELLELIELVQPLAVQPFVDPISAETMKHINIKSLLPILVSMSYVHLANYYINYLKRESKVDAMSVEFLLGFESPMEYFDNALKFWPTNPAAISLCAYYNRINCWCTIENICQRYVNAAEYALKWRGVVKEYLEDDTEVEPEIEGLNVKEWVELLMANGSLGMDCLDAKEEEEHAETQNVGDDVGEYSYSEIEATSAFMAALLLSTLGKHDEVLVQLRKFNLSHRIHPNVWKMAQSPTSETMNESTSNDYDDRILFHPKLYYADGVKVSDAGDYYPKGVLPPNKYQRLCKIFAPNASYWSESDYNNRGYYSYFIDLDDSSAGKSVRERPTNLIEDVIVNHLLPLAEKTLNEREKPASESESEKIIGAEWWCHTRQLGANLGHQMHFDTDGSLLEREKKVTHPVVSSVLYLSGAKQGTTETAKAGATIVCDQTPDSKYLPAKAWISQPKDNSLIIFPGNLLHGVLPCTGPDKPKTTCEYKKPENNRLTFMVGFWTRNVAEGMGELLKLYGPCGPLPPASKEHSWVIECHRGYDANDDSENGARSNTPEVKCHVLPCVSPAWEEFENNKAASPLIVPKGLDHRYFVSNAPHCFNESLFENEDGF